MSKFPRKFSVGTSNRPTHYALADDYYAASGAVEGNAPADVEFSLEEDHLTVRRKRPGQTIRASAATEIGPVYRLGDLGPLAVPTGKVFVRFADKDSFEGHRKEIEQAGFKIVQTLSHAPQAGWVEANSGKIADALSRFDALSRIQGVETVEPQMLLERKRR